MGHFDRRKKKSLDEWVKMIQDALDGPDDFPNPYFTEDDDEVSWRPAWITNWICMQDEVNPHDILEGLHNPPQWLVDWYDRHYNTDGSDKISPRLPKKKKGER